MKLFKTKISINVSAKHFISKIKAASYLSNKEKNFNLTQKNIKKRKRLTINCILYILLIDNSLRTKECIHLHWDILSNRYKFPFYTKIHLDFLLFLLNISNFGKKKSIPKKNVKNAEKKQRKIKKKTSCECGNSVKFPV